MPEEIDEALFRTLLHASLPIDEIQSVIGLGGKKAGPLDNVVLIWVDDQDRPDFKNTVAAHNGKNEQQSGSFQLSWLYREMSRDTHLLLRIAMEKPTHSVFHLSFSLKRDFGVLLAVAQNRMVWLIPGPARPLSAAKILLDVETFFEQYKREFEWLLSLELSESQASELMGFLATWPYQPSR